MKLFKCCSNISGVKKSIAPNKAQRAWMKLSLTATGKGVAVGSKLSGVPTIISSILSSQGLGVHFCEKLCWLADKQAGSCVRARLTSGSRERQAESCTKRCWLTGRQAGSRTNLTCRIVGQRGWMFTCLTVCCPATV